MTELSLHVREFASRREGMVHAMKGGLWLHRHVWLGVPMAHLVSTDRDRLLDYGECVGIPSHHLQFKPLKDPRTGIRRPAWHWDLVGPFLPSRDRLTPCPAGESHRHEDASRAMPSPEPVASGDPHPT